ncbi:MAG: hypothetical protein M1497_12110 [Nitrospirae bacterium]|nr:hypothetical protein [Nitrospirota bacterium]
MKALILNREREKARTPMELIHEHLKNKRRIKNQRMVAISNSGFPESRHNALS